LKLKETEQDVQILKGDKITDGWLNRFMERNGKLSLRDGDPTANAQMDSLNKQTITSYFNSLKSVLEDNNFQSP